MKRKLIKLAMCAMAVLPMGAWADVVNNATATWLLIADSTSEAMITILEFKQAFL